MLSTYQVSAEAGDENEGDQQLGMEVKREVEKGYGRALLWIEAGQAMGRRPERRQMG